MGKDKNEDKHPTRERIKCLACDGTGVVYVINRGVQRSRTCMGCDGKGFFVA